MKKVIKEMMQIIAITIVLLSIFGYLFLQAAIQTNQRLETQVIENLKTK